MRPIVVCLILFVLSYQKSFSCDCQTPLLEEEIVVSQTILLGTVISTEQITIRPDRGTVHYLFSTKFRVEKRYKGTKSETIEVLSRVSGCAFPFEIDSTYILFSSRHPKYFKQFTTPCMRTAKASESASLISKLDKVEDQIYRIHLMEPMELYGIIWREEVFDRVEENPTHKMGFEETQDYIIKYLKPCEIICEPQNKRDSMIVQSPSFDAAVKRFTVAYEVDVDGQIINPWIESSWHSIPMKDDAVGCKKNALELVKKLPPLNPAEIKDVPVKSIDKFLVDFSLVAER
ncbi:MAG: hypothetical protein ACFHWX_07650 [Bacteroidota bacterium]